MTAADSRRFFQSHGRLDMIKLALAFFAIYFIWGSSRLACRVRAINHSRRNGFGRDSGSHVAR